MYHSPLPITADEADAPQAVARPHPATSQIKRLVDVTGALAALVFFAPLLLAVALLIRIDSRGPALFRQWRGGLNGRPFQIYKFRSMRAEEDGADVTHCRPGDDRVTRVGAFLRRTSLDELPQLINVLRGDMSLVGPRPHALAHDELYGSLLPEYARRSLVKPGLTGLAQVSGSRGNVAHLDAMRVRVAYDLDYIRQWSLGMDLRLIYGTAIRVFFDRNAY